MKPVTLAAIVNSFNRLALLTEGLPALVGAFSGLECGTAVVVFEAGSTDGSNEWLELYAQESPVPIHLVRPGPDGDSSFSAGVNSACEYALGTYPGIRHLFLYETDNWVASPQPLRSALDLLELEPKLGAVGFTVTKHSGEPAGVGSAFPTAFEFVLGEQLCHRLKLGTGRDAPWQDTGVHRWRAYDVVYTSPLLVRADAWQQSQGLDERLFPFADCDVDWAWRLARLGWRQAVLQASGVVHDNREQLSEWSKTRVVRTHRARLQLLRRHRGGWVDALKPLLFARHLLELTALLAVSFKLKSPARSLQKRWLLLTSVFRDYEYSA